MGSSEFVRSRKAARSKPGNKNTKATRAVTRSSNASKCFAIDFIQGKEFFDLSMPRHWLRHACEGILIPIVFPAMSDENAAHLLDLLYEVPALHANSNSATLRTAGM